MAASRSVLRSLTFQLVRTMRARGNKAGLIEDWKNKIAIWAENNPKHIDAKAIQSILPLWHVRPVYTAQELAPILPSLFVAAGLKEYPGPAIGPAMTKNLLIKSGLPMLGNGKLYRSPVSGKCDQYFIVERIHYWAKKPVDQKDFETLWK